MTHRTLLEGSGDASLLPQLRYVQWRALRNAVITDRDGVAALDLETASLIDDGVDVDRWFEAAATADPGTTIEELRPQEKKQIAALHAAGIATAGDIVERLDPATARFGSWIRMAMLNARAATGPEPVCLLPGEVTDVPRADIEIDVDMESNYDGVYMWGAYVTDRANTAITPGVTGRSCGGSPPPWRPRRWCSGSSGTGLLMCGCGPPRRGGR